MDTKGLIMSSARFQLAPQFKRLTPGWHSHHTPTRMLFNHIRHEIRDTNNDSVVVAFSERGSSLKAASKLSPGLTATYRSIRFFG